MPILTTATPGSNFIGSYKKECNMSAMSAIYMNTIWINKI